MNLPDIKNLLIILTSRNNSNKIENLYNKCIIYNNENYNAIYIIKNKIIYFICINLFCLFKESFNNCFK